MKQKKGFILYLDQGNLFDSLPDDAAGRVIKAIFAYQKTGAITHLDPASNMLLMVICTQLDRDNEKWARTVELRAEAGRAGGKAKAENAKQMLANASKSWQTLANLADNDNDSDNDNVSDSESDSENDSDNGASLPHLPPNPNPNLRKPRGKNGHVLLTDEEVDTIRRNRPNDWEQKIQRLDDYIHRTGKQYNNHMTLILRWAQQDDADGSVHFSLERKQSQNDQFFDDLFEEGK